MAIDPTIVGTRLPSATMTIDEGRVRFFAKAIGETDPALTDTVPPTFLFSIELENPEPFGWLNDIGVDLRHVLHGEQKFTYLVPARPGDVVTAEPRITDVYSKKGGALEFVVKDTTVTRADGTTIAELSSVIVVRNPGATS